MTPIIERGNHDIMCASVLYAAFFVFLYLLFIAFSYSERLVLGLLWLHGLTGQMAFPSEPFGLPPLVVLVVFLKEVVCHMYVLVLLSTC